ncbi:MAG: hypothetical protein ABSD46_03370 [Bacteroidota bacterium]
MTAKQSVRSRKAGSRSRPSSLCDDETDKDWVTVGMSYCADCFTEKRSQ